MQWRASLRTTVRHGADAAGFGILSLMTWKIFHDPRSWIHLLVIFTFLHLLIFLWNSWLYEQQLFSHAGGAKAARNINVQTSFVINIMIVTKYTSHRNRYKLVFQIKVVKKRLTGHFRSWFCDPLIVSLIKCKLNSAQVYYDRNNSLLYNCLGILIVG